MLRNFFVDVSCLMLIIASQQQYLDTLQETKNPESAQQNINNSTATAEDTTIG